MGSIHSTEKMNMDSMLWGVVRTWSINNGDVEVVACGKNPTWVFLQKGNDLVNFLIFSTFNKSG